MKTNLKLTYLIVQLILIFLYRSTLAQKTINSNEWKEDLQFLAQTITKGHPDPYARMDKTAFEQAVNDLNKKIPVLKRNEIIVGMAKIVAMLHDAHSSIGLSWDKEIDFKRLPIRFYFYSDGLFVQSVTAGNEKILGARVTRIGKFSTEEALTQIRPIIHYDNEMTFKDVVTSRLTMPEVLQALGITDDLGQSEFEFLTLNNERIKMSFKPPLD
jgi:hypothetical protein